MPEWTGGAQDALQSYLNRLRESLGDSPDAAEVIADVEGHVREEVSRLNLSVVTADDVSAVLGRVGVPEPLAREPRADDKRLAAVEVALAKTVSPVASGCRRKLRSLAWFLFVYVFAVVAGLCTILFAFTFGLLSSSAAGTPIPTFWHFLLTLATVAGVVVGLHTRRARSRIGAILGALGSGLAAGVSTFYLLALVPFVSVLSAGMLDFDDAPIFFIPILFLLVILLTIVMTPFWCFLAAVVHGVGLGSTCGRSGPLGRGAFAAIGAVSFLFGFGLLFGYEVYTVKIVAASHDAIFGAAERRAEGLAVLRESGKEKNLRRWCYYSTKQHTPLLAYILMPERLRDDDEEDDSASLFRIREIPREEYQKLYYLVYGVAFNTKAQPDMTRGGSWIEDGRANWIASQEQGGREVAGRVRALSLATSDLSGVADATTATAYIEWTMEFKNKSSGEREARMQIAIPHDAVASELILWIDGEKRRAAFGSEKQVREASLPVVEGRVGPSLLTTKGRDRVMLQLFPVPPGGQEKMKIQIGLTVPLVERDGRQYLALPRIVERNFSVSRDLKHGVWIKWMSGAAVPTVAAPWQVSTTRSGQTDFRADLTDRQLLSYKVSTLSIPFTVPDKRTWATNATSKHKEVTQVRRHLQPGAGATLAPGGAVVLAVDGSAHSGFGRGADWWETMLAGIPDGTPTGVVFAGDIPDLWRDQLVRIDPATRREIAAWLAGKKYVGGRDSIPALKEALTLAPRSETVGSVVVWLHGPQPVLVSDVGGLTQQWRMGTGWAKIVSFAMHPGPNRILEKITRNGHGRVAPRLGDAPDDLAAVLRSLRLAPGRLSPKGAKDVSASRWSGGDVGVVYYHGPPPDGAQAAKADEQIVRLWGKERVEAFYRKGTVEAGKELATKNRLVTEHTGAVVLQMEKEYEANGLDPNAPSDVSAPAVPEPSTVLLIALGLIGVAYAAHRKRQKERLAA